MEETEFNGIIQMIEGILRTSSEDPNLLAVNIASTLKKCDYLKTELLSLAEFYKTVALEDFNSFKKFGFPLSPESGYAFYNHTVVVKNNSDTTVYLRSKVHNGVLFATFALEITK